MILIQFGRCVSDDIKTNLEENKVETVQEAAIKADEYAMNHRSNKFKRAATASNTYSKPNTTENKYMSEKSTKSFCFKCFGCGKIGHKKAQCQSRQSKESTNKDKKGVGCTTTFRNKCPKVGGKYAEVSEEFRPFVSEGTVSLGTNSTEEIPVKIVRDTCSGQSMILESTLSFGD